MTAEANELLIAPLVDKLRERFAGPHAAYDLVRRYVQGRPVKDDEILIRCSIDRDDYRAHLGIAILLRAAADLARIHSEGDEENREAWMPVEFTYVKHTYDVGEDGHLKYIWCILNGSVPDIQRQVSALVMCLSDEIKALRFSTQDLAMLK